MTNRTSIQLLLSLVFALSVFPATAQRIALKTNTIDWALGSANLSLETRVSPRVTVDLGIAGNPLKWSPYGSNYMLKNFRVNPEVRYWFNRPMARHFMGVAMTIGAYDLQVNKRRYKGDIVAAGVTYGYALVLNKHWNVEFTAGIGLGKAWGYKFRSNEEQPFESNMSKWIPVPIRTGISFSYIFK